MTTIAELKPVILRRLHGVLAGNVEVLFEPYNRTGARLVILEIGRRREKPKSLVNVTMDDIDALSGRDAANGFIGRIGAVKKEIRHGDPARL